ncbi:MAG: hypothetical protein QOE62_3324 [Actinomycetota bacterium]|nr:hypothetical protein [Actinomycetota bacterium]
MVEPDVGQRPSFDAVYRDLRPALIRTAFLIVGSTAEAEELVQDAFVQLHQRFEAIDAPAAYLRVALVRSCVRRNERRTMESDRLARMPSPALAGEPAVDEMWSALRRLRPERRAVLVLRFYEDLAHSEIARLLDCPVATVRSRVRRALTDLRKELDR